MRPWSVIFPLVVAALVVLVLGEAEATRQGVPVAVITRDPTVGGDVAPYVGAISILNTSLWGVVSALAAVAAWLVPAHRLPMTVLAVLTALLMVDDGLLLHETVLPGVGVPELAPMVLYAVVSLLLLLGFARTRTLWAPGAGLLVGGGLLLASVVVDLVLVDAYLLEDGLKLVGTSTWVAVPVLTLDRSRRRLVAERRSGAGPATGGARATTTTR